MEIELGKMYQYKAEHIGKIHSKKPHVPYAAANYETNLFTPRFTLTHGNPTTKEVPWEKSYYKTKQEKILVLPCELAKVCHPLIKSVYTTYIYSMISHSREGEWKTGWVQAEWIEPLDGLSDTYEETLRKAWLKSAKAAFIKIDEKIQAQAARPPKTPMEIFEELQAKRALGPKK